MFSFKFRHLGHVIPPYRKNVNTNVNNVNNNGPFKLPMINCLNKQIITPVKNCTVSELEKQFIQSVSNNKGKNVVFCSHTGLGDVLLNVGVINLLLNFYETVHYFCKKEYVHNISTCLQINRFV